MKNGLSYFQTGGSSDAPEAAVAPTKLPPTGKAPLDPTQTADLLANMQAMIDARQGPLASFNRGLERAAAWGSGGEQGPSAALARLNQQEQLEEKSTFDMRQQMAAFRTAQAQQEAFERRKAAELGGAPGAAPGAFGEAVMPPQIRTALNNARTQEDYNKIYNAWAQKQAEIYANPAMDEPKIPVVDMVDGNPVLKTISTREYRANPNRYRDTPQTQAAVQSVVAPTPGAPGAPVSVRNNNPGNLVDATGKIRTFATPAEGERALEADLQLKLSGQSPAVKERFGPQVGGFMSPSLLAETWAPSTAKGNSPQSTANYAKAISDALGIDTTSQIPNTPEALAKAKAAITKFEAGNYMPPATTPAAPAAPTTQQAPIQQRRPTPSELQTQRDIEKEGSQASAKEIGQSIGKIGTEITNLQRTTGEREARYTDILSLTEDPSMKELFGKLSKSGFVPFVLKSIETGVGIGQFGTIGIPDLEKNLAIVNATPAQIEKFRRVERHLKQAELEYARTYLQGQGAVSDNERRLVREATGSISDPAKVLQLQANVLLQRAKFDKKMADALDQYRDKNGTYADVAVFLRGPAKSVIAEHNRNLSKILGVDVPLDSNPLQAPPGEDKSTPAGKSAPLKNVPYKVIK
jgi:hypothetical protein